MKLLLPRSARKKGVRQSSQHALKAADKIGMSHYHILPRPGVELGAVLGQGAFGTVYMAKLRDGDADPVTCVAKYINPKKLQANDRPLLDSEMKIWSEVDHPHCVKFLGACIDPSEYLLVCEYMKGGSLLVEHQRLLKEGAPKPSEEKLTRQLLQIASGMAYLHAKHVIHRDLKSANLLLDGPDRIAISDFGLARVSSQTRACLTAETGSYRWMAPEVMRHEPYGTKCDVYSFAIVGWEMLTYELPFDKLSPVQAAFAVADKAARPRMPVRCPPAVRELLELCWAQSADERPAFDAVCRSLEAMMGQPAPADLEGSPESSAANALKRPSNSESSEETGGLKRPKSISSAMNALGMEGSAQNSAHGSQAGAAKR